MLKIVKSNEPMFVDRINLCIYGAPGLGKTSLGFTAEAPLNLDFDRGAYRAANRKDVHVVDNWSELTSMTANDLEAYKTIVVDTAGRALDLLTQDIIRLDAKMGRGGSLTLQGYGQLKVRFINWLKLLNSYGKDVVLIAHMDEQRSGDDVIERLDIVGSSKGEIYKSSDAMGRIILANNQRFIDFSPRANAFGKNPCNLPLIEFPSPAIQADTLAKVIAQIKASINQLSKEQQDQQNFISEWMETLLDFNVVEDFNTHLDELRKAPLSVRSMANKRAKLMGFHFNKETKLYEDTNVTA